MWGEVGVHECSVLKCILNFDFTSFWVPFDLKDEKIPKTSKNSKYIKNITETQYTEFSPDPDKHPPPASNPARQGPHLTFSFFL